MALELGSLGASQQHEDNARPRDGPGAQTLQVGPLSPPSQSRPPQQDTAENGASVNAKLAATKSRQRQHDIGTRDSGRIPSSKSAAGESKDDEDAKKEPALGSKRWHGRRVRSKRGRLGEGAKDPLLFRSQLAELPQPVLVDKLLVFLEARDLLDLAVTCASLQRAADDPQLWRRLLYYDFSAPRQPLPAGFVPADLPLLPPPPPQLAAASRRGSLDLERGLDDVSDTGVSGLLAGGLSSASIQQTQSQAASSASSSTQSSAWSSWRTMTLGGSPVVRPAWARAPWQSAASDPTGATGTRSGDDDGNNDAQLALTRFAPCREKAIYLQHIHDYEERVRIAAMEVVINAEISELAATRAKTERAIRSISLGLTTPMIGICPLLLFILVGLSMDHRLDASIWVIMAPLLFLFGLFALCILIGAVLFLKRVQPASLFYGMYPNYRGFIQFWMHKMFREEPLALSSGLVLYASLVLFVIFIGLRVEETTMWPWTATFSPFWVMLLIFALSPFLRWCGAHEDMDDFKTPYLVLMFSVWLPVAAFAVILPLYLDHYVSASIAVVLIPLWVFEGELVVFLLVTLVQSLYTRKDISDSLLVVFVMLVIFTPLVAFQVLLVIKLEAAGQPLTWMEVFTPLFVWFGICTLYLINVTVYDEAPPHAEMSSAHPKVLEKLNLHRTMGSSRPGGADMASGNPMHPGAAPWPRHRGQSIATPESARRVASERARASRAASSSRP